MTTNEARHFKEGDRVHFHADEACCGTVTEVGYNAVKVAWDDGQIGVTREFGDIHRIARS